MENINYDEDQDDIVPEVYREHRHKFGDKPKDLSAYKRQLKYRCAHIGTKELEILLRDYLTLNQDKMDYAETERFDDEILNVENPIMLRYLVNHERPLAPEHDTKYMNIMCQYV